MRFWAFVYAAVTVWLARFKTEDPVSEDDPDMDVRKVYSIMWSILRLKSQPGHPRKVSHFLGKLIIFASQISNRSYLFI